MAYLVKTSGLKDHGMYEWEARIEDREEAIEHARADSLGGWSSTVRDECGKVIASSFDGNLRVVEQEAK